MKKRTWILAAGLLTMCLSACGAQTSATNEATVKREEQMGEGNTADSVTVTANSSVYAVPDIVAVNFGMQSQASSAEAAQEANERTTNSVTECLKALGIEDKNIKTSGFDMYPRYNNSGQISGYNVHTTLTVLDIAIADAGHVISEAISAGANQVNGLNYSCSNYDDFYNEALAKALEIAKGKGETLAKAADRTLLREYSIVEGYQDVTYRYNTRNYAMSAKQEMADEAGGMSIEPGEAEIKAVVTVTYGLE